jgi:hypothetical protein
MLAPAATREVQVAFDPITTGPKSAALMITSYDADEPTVDVDLMANALTPVELSVLMAE